MFKSKNNLKLVIEKKYYLRNIKVTFYVDTVI